MKSQAPSDRLVGRRDEAPNIPEHPPTRLKQKIGSTEGRLSASRFRGSLESVVRRLVRRLGAKRLQAERGRWKIRNWSGTTKSEGKMAKRPKATDLTVAVMDRNDTRVIGQQVVARILDLIRTGSLHAGDRLPPERELIEIFGISRPSLREALRALSMLGVVKALHGGGAYVSDLDARTLLAPLDFYLSLTKANFADAFDSRRVIEVEIARRAASRATSPDIDELNDIIGAHDKVQDDPIGFRILDVRFHEKLSAVAGNAVLQRIADGLYNLGLDFQNFGRRAQNEPGLIAQSTMDHSTIAAGITARDPDRAADAMSRHIRNIEVSTQRVLSDRGVTRSLNGGTRTHVATPRSTARKSTTPRTRSQA
jgi:GntR family transcriptional regulator, transcriptional repressor for pyruvate dehydrogenase complex